MKSKQFFKVCAELMYQYDLKGWRIIVKIFDEAEKQRALAYCDCLTEQLVFSREYIVSSDILDITDTIIHEIGHALYPPQFYTEDGHDGKWLEFAKKEGIKYEFK
jgi:hypothetical protein